MDEFLCDSDRTQYECLKKRLEWELLMRKALSEGEEKKAEGEAKKFNIYSYGREFAEPNNGMKK